MGCQVQRGWYWFWCFEFLRRLCLSEVFAKPTDRRHAFRYSKIRALSVLLGLWSLSNNPLLKSSQEKYLFTFMSKAWPQQLYIDSADNALEISRADLALLIASDGDASFRWFAVFQSDPQQSLLLYHRSRHPITLDNGNTYCSVGVQWGYNWVP